MKFIADSMLDRLAKWMRIMGCDVEYYSKIEDGELVDLALREGRIILTKDTLVIKRKKAKGNFFLVEGNNYQDQLKQIVKRYSIDPYQNLLTRCIECNVPLEGIDKERIIKRVPKYVYETQESFSTCPKCNRLYWNATHKDKILRVLSVISSQGIYYSKGLS